MQHICEGNYYSCENPSQRDHENTIPDYLPADVERFQKVNEIPDLMMALQEKFRDQQSH